MIDDILLRMRRDLDDFVRANGGKDWRSAHIVEPDIDLVIQKNMKSVKIIWNGSGKAMILHFENETKMNKWLDMRTDFDKELEALVEKAGME